MTALRIYAFFIPVKPLNTVAAGYFQGIGKRSLAYIVSIADDFASLTLCAYILTRFMGLYGIWFSNVVSAVLLLAVIIIAGMSRRCENSKGIEKLLFLPDSFGIPEEDSISISVHSKDEVVGISRKVWDFCKAHGVDRRRTYLSSLCIEEMAGNTVEYGFPDGKKHTVYIRVLVSGDDVILRLKDDCMRFNMKDKAANWSLDPEHPEENIGIRMVPGLSKDVSYANTVNMNNLLITI